MQKMFDILRVLWVIFGELDLRPLEVRHLAWVRPKRWVPNLGTYLGTYLGSEIFCRPGPLFINCVIMHPCPYMVILCMFAGEINYNSRIWKEYMACSRLCVCVCVRAHARMCLLIWY